MNTRRIALAGLVLLALVAGCGDDSTSEPVNSSTTRVAPSIPAVPQSHAAVPESQTAAAPAPPVTETYVAPPVTDAYIAPPVAEQPTETVAPEVPEVPPTVNQPTYLPPTPGPGFGAPNVVYPPCAPGQDPAVYPCIP